MLGEICAHLRNYFVRSESDKHSGKFKIVNGSMEEISFLAEGQYFRVIGSVFNDGVYRYPVSNLSDEVFDGEVWAMAIPSGLLELSEEIKEWRKKYKDVIDSPYTSESFGGYAYTKSGGVSVSGSAGVVTWQSVFKSRLNEWRKL